MADSADAIACSSGEAQATKRNEMLSSAAKWPISHCSNHSKNVVVTFAPKSMRLSAWVIMP
ncbi:hypothetical protein D3C71_2219230 [compost metagenome]